MPRLGYLWLVGEQGFTIKGPVTTKGRELSIEISGYQHQIMVPADDVTDNLTDYPRHHKIKVRKLIDKTTVILRKYLTENKIFSYGEIRWYEVVDSIDGTVEVESYCVEFGGMTVSGIKECHLDNISGVERYEEIEFKYSAFSWTDKLRNRTFEAPKMATETLVEPVHEQPLIPQRRDDNKLYYDEDFFPVISLEKKPYHGDDTDFYYHSTSRVNLWSIMSGGLAPVSRKTACRGATLSEKYLYSDMKSIAVHFYPFLLGAGFTRALNPQTSNPEMTAGYVNTLNLFLNAIRARFKRITGFSTFDDCLRHHAQISVSDLKKDYFKILDVKIDWDVLSPKSYADEFAKDTKTFKYKKSVPSGNQKDTIINSMQVHKDIFDIITSHFIYKSLKEAQENNLGTLCLAKTSSIMSTYINDPHSRNEDAVLFRIPKK